MQSGRSVNVTDVINQAKISAFQFGVYVLLFLVIALDSYDTQSISFAAPSISKAWGVSPASFGLIFSSGLSGLAVGALFGGRLADRIGRRWMVIASVTWFGIMTLACAYATSYTELLILRFVAGIGLGGAVANFFTLIAEYSPIRSVLTIVAVTNWGTPIGAVVGGSVAGKMIETWGWQSVFYLGGVLPLLFVPVLIAFLPESVRFLTLDPSKKPKIARILSRIEPGQAFSPSDDFHVAEQPGKRGIAALFRDGLAPGTIFLSLTMALSLLLVFCVVNYLPLLLKTAGVPLGTAVMGGVVFNLSGLLGSFLVSLLVSRFVRRRPFALLAASYVVGGLGATMIWAAGSNATLALAAVFFTGFFVIGAQISVGAFIASYYPTAIRGTGVGFCQGFSRIGALTGPLVGAAVLANAAQPTQLFLFCPIPALAAALCLILLWRATADKPGTAKAAGDDGAAVPV
ncbi:MAG TPA: MFS transporter [Caulobacteraceae bacterium]|jgi:AAHS family 4-hydroxybenzoate transporter-like MFS transporter|nr:MFS transporter [Caulobacteraceae bacterium]